MIRDDLSNAEYHALDGISSSDVKIVHAKSIAHWRHKNYKDSPVLDLGSAVHAMVLEPEKSLIVRGPETRRGNEWKHAKEEAESQGKLLLTEADFDQAQRMAEAIMMTPRAARMFNDKDCLKEQSIITKCKHTGLTLKCRPDALLPEKAVIDIKTTQDASPRGFAKSVRGYGYDLQAWFYLYACAEFSPQTFGFVCVEKEPPYVVSMHVLDQEYLRWAKGQVLMTLDEIKRAQDSKDFSTGWPEISIISKPAWLSEEPEEVFA